MQDVKLHGCSACRIASRCKPCAGGRTAHISLPCGLKPARATVIASRAAARANLFSNCVVNKRTARSACRRARPCLRTPACGRSTAELQHQVAADEPAEMSEVSHAFL